MSSSHLARVMLAVFVVVVAMASQPMPARMFQTPSPSPSATASPSPSPSGGGGCLPLIGCSGGSQSPAPSGSPSGSPTTSPSASPSGSPSASPSGSPSGSPSVSPSDCPIGSPTSQPTSSPTATPGSASHGREITIGFERVTERKGGLIVEGRVSVPDGFKACRKNAPVEVQRRVSGDWVTRKSTTTSRKGRYAVEIRNLKGRYRSIAVPTEIAQEDGSIEPCRRVKVTARWRGRR